MRQCYDAGGMKVKEAATNPTRAVFHLEQREEGVILIEDVLPDCLDGKQCNVEITDLDGKRRIYPVFQQKAYQYGKYSEYMKRHGCACCSLTTLLASLSPEHSGLRPEETVERVEKTSFLEKEWKKNYSRHIARQMPVSLYGISKILHRYHIAHRYVGAFCDDSAATEIKAHLFQGKPVVIETSRMRRKNGKIEKYFDKRFAGSYHTMILLGIDRKGKVIFTDSATRTWAGKRQRLKWADLEELLPYMSPQKNTADTHVYFSRRKNTGGYFLIYDLKPRGYPAYCN